MELKDFGLLVDAVSPDPKVTNWARYINDGAYVINSSNNGERGKKGKEMGQKKGEEKKKGKARKKNDLDESEEEKESSSLTEDSDDHTEGKEGGEREGVGGGGGYGKVNVRFESDGRVVSLRAIFPREELFADYGRSYWKYHKH